uniref:ATP synthase complex subunit 8 n=1 Tax=Ailurops ursinus TaxID=165204 RepID=A0A075QR78_AILUR|nr:ATP synthase F0 subunit 8 [Ailurops ursinus]
MPQLNTSTWFPIITMTIISLFCVYQMKMINHTMISITPQNNKNTTPKALFPWEKKWTKIYLPNSMFQLL